MEEVTINRENIIGILKAIDSSKFSCDKFIKACIKNGERILVGENIYKTIIRDFSSFIKVIIVECNQNSITNVTFYGTFFLSHVVLEELFGICTTNYIAYDDVTFYYFKDVNTECMINYFIDAQHNEDLNVKGNISNISFVPSLRL